MDATINNAFIGAINANPLRTFTIIAEDASRTELYHVGSADMRIVRERISDAKKINGVVWAYAIDNETGEIVAE